MIKSKLFNTSCYSTFSNISRDTFTPPKSKSINICLSCDSKRCSGDCPKIHTPKRPIAGTEAQQALNQ